MNLNGGTLSTRFTAGSGPRPAPISHRDTERGGQSRRHDRKDLGRRDESENDQTQSERRGRLVSPPAAGPCRWDQHEERPKAQFPGTRGQKKEGGGIRVHVQRRGIRRQRQDRQHADGRRRAPRPSAQSSARTSGKRI